MEYILDFNISVQLSFDFLNIIEKVVILFEERGVLIVPRIKMNCLMNLNNVTGT